MKQMILKRVSLLICLCMLFGAMAQMLTVGAQEMTMNYVSIGDSLASGELLEGNLQGDANDGSYDFVNGSGVISDSAYPGLFASWLAEQGYTVNHTPLVSAGMRAEELNYLIGGRTEMPDDWSGMDAFGTTDFAAVSAYMIDAVKGADLISLSIGNDTFGSVLLQRIADTFGVIGVTKDLGLIVDGAFALGMDDDQANVVKEIISRLSNTLIGADEDAKQKLDGIVSYTVASFLVNYKSAISTIRSLNADARILITGVTNTLPGVVLDMGAIDVDYTVLLDEIIVCVNEYIRSLRTANASFLSFGATETSVYSHLSEMKENGWAVTSGINAGLIRARNLSTHNDILLPMVSGSFSIAQGYNIPAITMEDVLAYDGTKSILMMKHTSAAIFLAAEDVIVSAFSGDNATLPARFMLAGGMAEIFSELSFDSSTNILMVKADMLYTKLTDYLMYNSERMSVCKGYGLLNAAGGINTYPDATAHVALFEALRDAYLNEGASGDGIEGDVNGDGSLNSNDALYLLRSTMNSETFPLVTDGDVNSDGRVNSNDALYLLRHTMSPERFPLYA